ncbi:MAG: PKD domain-containing protein [Candidatus Binatus sp.]
MLVWARLPGFFAALRMTKPAFAVALLLLGGLSTPALAQEPTATATPMMLPSIPQIQLTPLPGYGPAPLTVGFMVSSTDPETVLQTFRWNFGDGQVSMLPPTALFHTYTNPGSYVVTVTATTADGHQASSFAGVIVTQPPQ